MFLLPFVVILYINSGENFDFDMIVCQKSDFVNCFFPIDKFFRVMYILKV